MTWRVIKQSSISTCHLVTSGNRRSRAFISAFFESSGEKAQKFVRNFELATIRRKSGTRLMTQLSTGCRTTDYVAVFREIIRATSYRLHVYLCRMRKFELSEKDEKVKCVCGKRTVREARNDTRKVLHMQMELMRPRVLTNIADLGNNSYSLFFAEGHSCT